MKLNFINFIKNKRIKFIDKVLNKCRKLLLRNNWDMHYFIQ
jgi:hypothetical protein